MNTFIYFLIVLLMNSLENNIFLSFCVKLTNINVISSMIVSLLKGDPINRKDEGEILNDF